MRIFIFVAAFFIVLCGCSPKQSQRELVSFSYIQIDMAKLEAKDYSEVVDAVNTTFSKQKREFVDARLLKEEGMFSYFHVYSSVSTACYRVTVDRNRSKIISIQPDCPIEE